MFVEYNIEYCIEIRSFSDYYVQFCPGVRLKFDD